MRLDLLSNLARGRTGNALARLARMTLDRLVVDSLPECLDDSPSLVARFDSARSLGRILKHHDFARLTQSRGAVASISAVGKDVSVHATATIAGDFAAVLLCDLIELELPVHWHMVPAVALRLRTLAGRRFLLDAARLEGETGIQVSSRRAKRILRQFGYESDSTDVVRPPLWRPDIQSTDAVLDQLFGALLPEAQLKARCDRLPPTPLEVQRGLSKWFLRLGYSEAPPPTNLEIQRTDFALFVNSCERRMLRRKYPHLAQVKWGENLLLWRAAEDENPNFLAGAMGSAIQGALGAKLTVVGQDVVVGATVVGRIEKVDLDRTARRPDAPASAWFCRIVLPALSALAHEKH